MHLIRANITKKVPIKRKGTKYVARSLSHVNESISVLVAVRDMLCLAKTSKEVKEMIKNKLIKINSRVVKDYRESICLFNILEAGKKYKLTLLPTGRFYLEETNDSARIAKIVNKTILKKNKTQLNLHDGTNVQTDKGAKVGDSVELDMKNKIKKIIHFEKGKKVFIIRGRNLGQTATISNVENSKVKLNLEGREVVLNKEQLIALWQT